MNEKHYLGHRKRLREKLISHPESIFDYELIELLLFGILPRKDTKILAKEIMDIHDGSLNKLFFSDFSRLLKISGISEASVGLFKTIAQIFKKINEENFSKEEFCFLNMGLLVKFLKSKIAFAQTENFCEIYLNSQLKLIKYEIHDYGTINEVAIYNREIVKKALEYGALHLIIAHNHPSESNANPSEQDKKQTIILNNLCTSLGIELIDHVILSGHNYFSFYENGLM